MQRPGGRWWAAVLAIAALGLVLRTWHLDFDQRQHQHPDERHWSLTSSAIAAAPPPAPHGTLLGPALDWLDGQRSPANAYRGADSFVYGPAPLAVSRAAAGWLHRGAAGGDQPASLVVHALDGLGIPLLDDAGAPRFDAAYGVDLVGRLVGALTDTLTIVVVALIGRRLGGRAVGLVAAGLAASSVLAIQHAHFLGSEPALGLAAAVCVLALLHLDRGADERRAAVTGGLLGLATGATLAMKVTGAGLVVVPLAGAAALLVRHRRPADWVRLAAVAIGAVVAFRILCPGAFDGLSLRLNDQFVDDLRRSREVAAADLPPALQWADRTPLDGLRWLLLFTVGPGTMVAAVVGLVALGRRGSGLAVWSRTALAAAWLVPLAFVFRDEVTSGRYFVPMLPALHAVAAYGIVRLWRSRSAATASTLARRRRVAPALAAALVGLSALWGGGFVAGVHGREHTRVQATRWIDENVETGAVLSSEGWDDGLPLHLPGIDPARWSSEGLDLFGPDSVEKAQTLADSLGRVDYVVESSPRVWRTVPRIPARYPSTIRFFDGLDDGSLGFERVATFTRSIGIGPLRLPDGSAEEAFSVYDHPEVRIWRKVRDLPARERLGQLDPVAAATALPVVWQQGHANGAQLLPDERVANEGIGTFADDFDEDGNPLLHALGWLLVLELLGLATFALLAPALRSLPDAGAGVSKLIGLVVVTTGVFVAVTWGGRTLSAGIVALVAGAWVLAGAGAAVRRRALLRELWRDRRRALVQAELVTLAGFAILLLVRAADPDLWHVARGGEKPFELEMLTATLRTRTLPPYDPWFAGGTLNYYYGGYLLLSVPARLLRTAPSLAMNLGVPVVAALTAGAAYSAGAAVASTARRWRQGTQAAVGAAATRAGLLAAGLLLLVPNAAMVPAIFGRLTGGERGPFDWWGLSRTIPGSPAPTEFPAWSLLFADLHPHLVDLALLIAVLPLAVAWHRTLGRDGPGRHAVALGLVLGALLGAIRAVNTWDLPLAGLVVLTALALAVLRHLPIAAITDLVRPHPALLRRPTVAPTPTPEPVGEARQERWAPPTGSAGSGRSGTRAVPPWWPVQEPVVASTSAGAARSIVEPVDEHGPAAPGLMDPLPPVVEPGSIAPHALDLQVPAEWPERRLLVRWGAAAGAVAAVALGGWGPYASRTEVTDAGIQLERLLQTPAASWAAQWGFLAAVSAAVVGVVIARGDRAAREWALLLAGTVGLGLCVLAGAAPQRMVLALDATLALAAGAAAWACHVRGERDRPLVLPLVLVSLGWTMQAGIEVITVINDFDRQNTIFKGWFQSWMLLCIGLAVALGSLATPTRRLWSSLEGLAPRVRYEALTARGILAVAVLLATAFVQLAVPSRLDDRSSSGGLSLDGVAYLRDGIGIAANEQRFDIAEDLPLVEWLQQHVAGAVTIAEYPHDDYSWSGRMAALTGLPTVLAWPYHQSQQRRAYGVFVDQRRTDLQALYQDGDAAVQTSVLQRYRVAFVVWGTTERSFGTHAARVALLDSPCLTVRTETGDLFIAEVDQPCLAERPGSLPVRSA